MQHELIPQLKKLNAIEPDAGFVARSRATLTARSLEPAQAVAQPFRWSWSMRLAGALAVLTVAVGTISYLFPPKPVLSSSLNADNLNAEFASTVGLQVQELSYSDVSGQTINSAIGEITNTKTRHLNSDVITNEAATTEPTLDMTDNSKSIDDLLNQVTK